MDSKSVMAKFGDRISRAPANTALRGADRILIQNPSAGNGDFSEDLFRGFVPVLLPEVHAALRHADDRATVAVWGGDGTCRTVAALTLGTSKVLLPCPGGTHNHFAKAAGFSSLNEVATALACPSSRTVDVGLVNDEPFLNNLAVGWYVDLVARRERYEQRMPRRIAKLISVIMHMGSIRRLRVTIDGKPERLWMLWIGNGEYSLEPGKMSQRPSLTGGKLDIRVLRADSTFPKLKALLAVVMRRAEESHLIDQRLGTSCTLEFVASTVNVALDGELVKVKPPLRIRTSRSLRLMNPN